MDLHELLRRVDHTLLKQEATWPQIQTICDEAMAYQTASACIPPSFVAQACAYVAGKLPICTVIGFPAGYQTTEAKCFEARDAVGSGADEIDMVVNLGWVKEGAFDRVLEEVRTVKQACDGKLLKVIIETCLLTDAEKIALCDVVSRSGADYIKTSTGFSTAGATVHDIELFAAHVASHVKIKAAGGISTAQDAEALVAAGAHRLGTSRLVKLAKEAQG